jgi:hypothetical protein
MVNLSLSINQTAFEFSPAANSALAKQGLDNRTSALVRYQLRSGHDSNDLAFVVNLHKIFSIEQRPPADKL